MLTRISAGILALALLVACSEGEKPPLAEADPPTATSPTSVDDPLPARWWQWAASFTRGEDPISDPTGARCGENQPDDVWFLAGTFGGAVRRICRVPADRPVYLPVLNQVCEAGDDARRALEDCRFGVDEARATLDGRPLTVEEDDAAAFDLEVAEDSATGFPAGRTTAVAWGDWVGPLALAPGRHVLAISGAAGDFTVAVRYRLVVG